MRQAAAYAVIAGALIGAFGPGMASAGEFSWSGTSDNSGGAATYAISNPTEEQSESGSFEIRCNLSDASLRLSFFGDHSADPADAVKAIYLIDGDRFERRGTLANQGLFPATPAIETTKGDPLIEAMMSGSSMKIFVGTVTNERPAFEASLTGTRALSSNS